MYRISAPANPESGLFFRNPGKSGSSQISSQICWMPLQLQYSQLIMDKTNAADLSSGVFAILISVTRTVKIQISFHCRYTNIVKNWQTATNKGSTELYCLFILVADSIVDNIFSSGVLFCDPKTSPQIQIRFRTDLKYSNPAQP